MSTPCSMVSRTQCTSSAGVAGRCSLAATSSSCTKACPNRGQRGLSFLKTHLCPFFCSHTRGCSVGHTKVTLAIKSRKYKPTCGLASPAFLCKRGPLQGRLGPGM
ncbi:mCG145743, isoform CRA_e [Mus musculus]|nr:mCG145743, isoform CRA_e [Mus musculus]EDL06650.1 mCG145743, isoform CRA_e [Mus musculus]